MTFELNKAIAILARTPLILNKMLLGLTPDWTHKNEGGKSWSPFDVVGHLIHGEKTDWMSRTEIILSNRSVKKFEPYDRFAQINNSRGKSLEELLSEFSRLREENLEQLRLKDLSEEDLNLEGIHPELGKVTLRQLLAAWVVHDLGHIAQVSRTMAKQYKDEVGPWPKYLTILNTTPTE